MATRFGGLLVSKELRTIFSLVLHLFWAYLAFHSFRILLEYCVQKDGVHTRGVAGCF
jgi:hypothetical protein